MGRLRQGQSTVEYMLLISVISIALGAVLYWFSATTQIGARSASNHLASELTSGGVQ